MNKLGLLATALFAFAGCARDERAGSPPLAACGAYQCDAREQYCEIYLSDAPEIPSDYACKPLPPACKPGRGAVPTCACFPADTPCLSFCGPLPTAGISAFHLTCQGKKKPPQ